MSKTSSEILGKFFLMTLNRLNHKPLTSENRPIKCLIMENSKHPPK